MENLDITALQDKLEHIPLEGLSLPMAVVLYSTTNESDRSPFNLR